MSYEGGKGRAATLEHCRRMRDLHCAELLAELGPDKGLWSWRSSPHVLWLACQLHNVCWLVPSA